MRQFRPGPRPEDFQQAHRPSAYLGITASTRQVGDAVVDCWRVDSQFRHILFFMRANPTGHLNVWQRNPAGSVDSPKGLELIHLQPDPDHNASRRQPSSADRLLEQLDSERLVVSDRLASNQRRRSALGQFITSAAVAEFMASMLDVAVPPTELRLLDAGSGTGMLTAAAVAEFCSRPENKRPSTIHVTAWEIDDFFEPLLHHTFQRCREICREHCVQFTWDLRCEDFISSAANIIGNNALPTGSEIAPFHVAILNPPYRKLNGNSVERLA